MNVVQDVYTWVDDDSLSDYEWYFVAFIYQLSFHLFNLFSWQHYRNFVSWIGLGTKQDLN